MKLISFFVVNPIRFIGNYLYYCASLTLLKPCISPEVQLKLSMENADIERQKARATRFGLEKGMRLYSTG